MEGASQKVIALRKNAHSHQKYPSCSWSQPADTMDVVSEKSKNIEQVSGESCHSPDVLSEFCVKW